MSENSALDRKILKIVQVFHQTLPLFLSLSFFHSSKISSYYRRYIMFKKNLVTVLGIFVLFVFVALGNIGGCHDDSGDGVGEPPLDGGDGPGSSLAPIKGIAYQPVPSDYPSMNSCSQIYFDTDFFNTDFTCLWQSGTGSRGDLTTIAQTLGANFLHLYDWNPQRDHSTFLDECQTLRIGVAVPFNNFFAGNPTGEAQGIVEIITEVYGCDPTCGTTPHPAVVMWTIANEYDLSGISAGQIAQVAQIILYTEQNIVKATATLPISSPVSFGASGDSNGTPAVAAIHDLFVAFSNTQEFQVTINMGTVNIPALPSNFWETRYVAATNPQNCGSSPDCASGITIQEYLSTNGGDNSFQSYFCTDSECDKCPTTPNANVNCFPQTNLWFSEIGTGVILSCAGWETPCTKNEQQQAAFDQNQLEASIPGTPSFFLGSAVFEFLDEEWKGPPTTNDATFGITKYSGTQIGTCNTSMKAPSCPNSPYPVDNLCSKPLANSIQQAFISGTPPPLPSPCPSPTPTPTPSP